MEIRTSLNEDQTLLTLLQGDSMEAFNALFRKYYRSLCAYAHRFVVREDVEEVVQDLFVWLWENRHQVAVHSALSLYLFRAVYTRCLNRIEKNEVKRRTEALYWEKHADHCEMEDYSTEELIAHIHESIQKLPSQPLKIGMRSQR